MRTLLPHFYSFSTTLQFGVNDTQQFNFAEVAEKTHFQSFINYFHLFSWLILVCEPWLFIRIRQKFINNTTPNSSYLKLLRCDPISILLRKYLSNSKVQTELRRYYFVESWDRVLKPSCDWLLNNQSGCQNILSVTLKHIKIMLFQPGLAQ